MSAAGASSTAWEDVRAAAQLFAVTPLGVSIHARPGPWRDWWLARVQELLPSGTVWRRVPAQVDAGRLLGGLDLAATLSSGRPITEIGVLAAAHRGVLVLSMAERLATLAAGIIANALDTGAVRLERDGITALDPAAFAVIALDESLDDEDGLAAGLADRMALHLELPAGRLPDVDADPIDRAAVESARARLDDIVVDDTARSVLSDVACKLGLASSRPELAALQVARAAAALDGATHVGDDHLALAIRLVLLPRVAFAPGADTGPPEPETDEQQDHPPSESEAPTADAPEASTQSVPEPEQDAVIDPSAARLPPDLLAQIAAAAARAKSVAPAGRSGPSGQSRRRGRPIGSTSGDPRQGARLDVIATLRAAAPWQRLRGTQGKLAAGRIEVRRSDFRVKRYKQHQETTTVFVVDASGSAAANRLGEAKGAVELLLADCYVRRDRVALIVFRGAAASVLLEPTRSLVRAKRLLARMPAGGGTPLAAGIDAAVALAASVTRSGSTPQLVFLTDGRANVGRDGLGGSEAAMRDALDAATRLRSAGYGSAVIDVSPRPRPFAADCAANMAARYLALPHADAGAIAAAARAVAA